MARFRVDPLEMQRAEQVTMNVLMTTGITREQLREAGPEQLLSLQTQLLMGSTWGLWEVTPELISPSAVATSRRTYKVSSALPDGMSPEDPAAKAAWCEVLRIAVSMRLWPGPKGRRYVYGSIRNSLETLGRAIRLVLTRDMPAFWSRISRDEFIKSTGVRGSTCCAMLLRLHREGAIGDAPRPRPRPLGKEGARDRTGEAEHTSSVESNVQWQPFPDSFTAQAGYCAIKLMTVVGPTLLDALEAAADVPIRTTIEDPRWRPKQGQLLTPAQYQKVRAIALDAVIQQWPWTAPDGSPLTQLPFEVVFRCKTGRFAWPPQTHHQAWSILSNLQTAHLWPIALATAGRDSEVRSLKENCLRRTESITPTGSFQTWKLDGIGGRNHEAPLPALVVTALQQQIRLSRVVKRFNGVDGDHLWTMVTKWTGQPMTDFRPSLLSFVKAFSLAQFLEGSNPHMHRFRKTLVRMVALALVHAPKVLMDVLGHRDEQMTVMRYILSDPDLLVEIQETVRELIVLKGVEAVKKSDLMQGKAAPLLRERVAEYAKRLGANAMEPQNLMEFVRAMTEGGTGWAVIAPGIICTGFTRGGLCNKGQGGANPHYCNPQCDNQLAMPDFEEDGVKVTSAVTKTIETLDYMLNRLSDAGARGEDMLIAQFAGQIKALLGRWREVDTYAAAHPLFKKLIPNVVLS